MDLPPAIVDFKYLTEFPISICYITGMSNTKKSLYRQCVAAVGRLRNTPPKEHEGVFTEIDVQMSAARSADPKWDENDHRLVLHEANAVCGAQYRGRKLCRYGPVILEDGSEDYARIAGKIVYADAESGPEFWETPNGRFPKLMLEDDTLSKQGRRAGTDRNDALPWTTQSVKPRQIHRRSPSAISSVEEEIDWEARIKELTERVESLEAEKAVREAFFRSQIAA